MSPRQQRRERREAERKSRKAEIRRDRQNQIDNHSEPEPTPHPFPQTGPRTEAGKAISSQNARKHGLTSKMLIHPGEDPNEFEAFAQALLREHKPATETERILVTEMIENYWRLRRIRNRENQLWKEGAQFDDKRLALCHRYATSHERSFHRALKALKQLQKERLTAERDFVSQTESQAESSTPELAPNFNATPQETELNPGIPPKPTPELYAHAPQP
jgi:hypothetical protein